MYKIGIIQNIHEEGIKILKNNKNFEYEIIDDVSEENILKKIHLYDGVSLRTSKLTNKILSKASRLKVISRHGVGFFSPLDISVEGFLKYLIDALPFDT